jgi:hypothetical protein
MQIENNLKFKIDLPSFKEKKTHPLLSGDKGEVSTTLLPFQVRLGQNVIPIATSKHNPLRNLPR